MIPSFLVVPREEKKEKGLMGELFCWTDSWMVSTAISDSREAGF